MALPDTWAELLDRTRARDPSDSRHPVPWGPRQLDGGVWLARSAAEQEIEAARSWNEFARLAGDGAVPYRRLPDRTRAAHAVGEAGRWTRGATRHAPVSGLALPVTGASISAELALAVEVVQNRAEGWPEALGAFVWLRWLTGRDDAIYYPLW